MYVTRYLPFRKNLSLMVRIRAKQSMELVLVLLKTWSTFNSLMTLIRLWSLIYGIVISILSIYIAQWNTLCQILKTLRNLFIA